MSGQGTPGFIAACTARFAASTASYTIRWSAVKRPFTGYEHVTSDAYPWYSAPLSSRKRSPSCRTRSWGAPWWP